MLEKQLICLHFCVRGNYIGYSFIEITKRHMSTVLVLVNNNNVNSSVRIPWYYHHGVIQKWCLNGNTMMQFVSVVYIVVIKKLYIIVKYTHFIIFQFNMQIQINCIYRPIPQTC